MKNIVLSAKKADVAARSFRLQKRWKFCQHFAVELYRSDFDDDELQAVAASIATAMRSREDAAHHHLVESEHVDHEIN